MAPPAGLEPCDCLLYGVFAVKYNGSTYYYRKNAQNDIIALLDNYGNTVVKYKYDAWGNCIIDASTTNIELANINPFRYRSYYFDTETSLYFLKTRYYDPEIGRFITIDDISYLDPESINGLNLYAYCKNSPMKYIDPNGKAVITLSALLIAFAVGAVLGGIFGGISAAAQGQNIFAGLVVGALVGGFTGALAEFSWPIAIVGTFAVGFLGDIASQKFVEGKSFDDINLVQSFGSGLLNAVLSIPAIGLSRIVRHSGITNPQSFLFGLASNAPMMLVSILGNYCISQTSTTFGIYDFISSISPKITKGLEIYIKEFLTRKKGFYYYAI